MNRIIYLNSTMHRLTNRSCLCCWSFIQNTKLKLLISYPSSKSWKIVLWQTSINRWQISKPIITLVHLTKSTHIELHSLLKNSSTTKHVFPPHLPTPESVSFGSPSICCKVNGRSMILPRCTLSNMLCMLAAVLSNRWQFLPFAWVTQLLGPPWHWHVDHVDSSAILGTLQQGVSIH